MAKPVSLRRRLTWYVVFTLVVMTTVSGVMIFRGTGHEADEIFSASLVQTARILDGLVNLDSIESNRDQLKRALNRGSRKHEYERKLFFAIFSSEGDLLLHSRKAPEIPHTVVQSGFSEFKYKQKKWNTFALNSSRDDLLIVVGERSEIREEITEYVGSGLILPLIFLLPVVLWFLWQIIGVALRPLQTVTDQVLQQDIRKLKRIDVEGVPAEITPLVSALNQMISDLDAAYARERRFVGDASHELRNPLASLLINVDNAIEENVSESSIESLCSMKISIKRLSHLVSQLLQLSHTENPLSSGEFDKIDLGSLCESVVEGLSARAKEASIELTLELQGQGQYIEAVDALLRSLLVNLIDNGIKYCPSGSEIRIQCGFSGGRVFLYVEDSGSGLDQEQREKVLQRFYRIDHSSADGAGLGLSIVHSIVESHRGNLKMEASEMGGLAVRIDFPSCD